VKNGIDELPSPNEVKSIGLLTISTITSSTSLTPACNDVTPAGMLCYGLYYDQSVALLVQMLLGTRISLMLGSGLVHSRPERLALGCMSELRDSYKRDLERLLKLEWQYLVPLIVPNGGGDGIGEQLMDFAEIVRESAETEGNE
jgi:hypothetical protein